MKIFFAAVALSVASMMPVSMANSQNLVPNPNFDDGTAQWTLDNGAAIPAAALNTLDGSPQAPSLVLDAIGGIASAKTSCMLVDRTQRYDVSVDIFGNSGPVFFSVLGHSDTACAGNGSFATNPLSHCDTLPTGWKRCYSANFGLPFNAVAATVRFFVFTDGRVTFDNVRFGLVGTAPVSLQSYSIE